MSLCVALILKDTIYMSADSRVSAHINDQKFQWHDDYCKIERVDGVDNFIIFKGGEATEMNHVVERFKNSNIRDLTTYQNISIEEYQKYIAKEGVKFKPFSETNKMTVASLIGTFEGDMPVLYYCGDSLGFNLIKIELGEDQDIQDVTLGCMNEEAREIYLQCKFDFDDIQNVFQNYRRIYETVANEDIGGILTFYKMSKGNEIKKLQCALRDPENLNRLSDYLENHDINYQYTDDNNLIISGRLYANQLFIGNSSLNALIDGQINGQVVAAGTVGDTQIGSLSCSKLLAGTINASITINSPVINGGVITGTTIKGSVIESVNNSGQLNGMCVIGENLGSVYYYYNGEQTAAMLNNGSSGFGLMPFNQYPLYIGNPDGSPVEFVGNVSFSGATVTGLTSVAVFG